jgi:hypothetical protein
MRIDSKRRQAKLYTRWRLRQAVEVSKNGVFRLRRAFFAIPCYDVVIVGKRLQMCNILSRLSHEVHLLSLLDEMFPCVR